MPVTIDGFFIDASLSENEARENDVTDYPVESGSSKTDNIRRKPTTVTMQAVVSDTPIGKAVDQRAPGTLPSGDTYDLLDKIDERGEPVVISTSRRVYRNMAMMLLSIPEDARTGGAIRFTATFKQIEIVQNDRTTIRVREPRSKAKVNFGDKASTEVLRTAAEGALAGTQKGPPTPFDVPVSGTTLGVGSAGLQGASDKKIEGTLAQRTLVTRHAPPPAGKELDAQKRQFWWSRGR